MNKSKILQKVTLTCLSLFIFQPLLKSQTSVKVLRAVRVNEVRVRLTISNHATNEVSLPLCGDDNGIQIICIDGIQLQARHGLVWEQVQTRPGAVEFATRLPHRQIIIKNGSETECFLNIDEDVYAVEPGTVIRIVVKGKKSASNEEVLMLSQEFIYPIIDNPSK